MSSLSKAVRDEILAGVDVYSRVAALPDGKPISTSEAAIFLGFSVTTLERLRAAGVGPTYEQLALPGLGPNTKVTYTKASLKEFQERKQLSSSMEAAVRRGMAFATSLDLEQEEAFYIDADGDVAGMVERTPLGVVLDRLGEWDIAWMRPVDAAAERWRDVCMHSAFADEVRAEVQSAQSIAMQRIQSGVDSTEIKSVSREAPPSQTVGIDGAFRERDE